MAFFLRVVVVVILAIAPSAHAFQNLLPNFRAPKFGGGSPAAIVELEDELLQVIASQDERLSSSDEINALIGQLENVNSIPEPAISDKVYGRWRLMHTSNADTASPIQRKAVDATKYNIYQDIILNAAEKQLVVSQVVKFSDKFELRVDALASTEAYPLPELTERKSASTFGLSILGTSLVGDEALEDVSRPNSRIDFVFDEGNFQFGSLKVPYPVPFRLPILRDIVKGWIDVVYLSDRLRIAKGNKGTTFVLLKEE